MAAILGNRPAVALDETEAAMDAFWSPGDPAAEQGFTVLRPKSAVLADAMLRRCVVFWREQGKLGTARTVAHHAFEAGCRDSEVTASGTDPRASSGPSRRGSASATGSVRCRPRDGGRRRARFSAPSPVNLGSSCRTPLAGPAVCHSQLHLLPHRVPTSCRPG